MAKNLIRAKGDVIVKTEHIGSLLRPGPLLAARQRFAAGRLDAADLRAIEDDAITSALRAQEATGIEVVTDGEFRRTEFRGGVASAVSGLVGEVYDSTWHSSDGDVQARSRRWRVVAPLEEVAPLAGDEADFLASNTRTPYKITLPAPSFMAARSFSPTDGVYASMGELTEAFTGVIGNGAAHLIERGVRLPASARDRKWFRGGRVTVLGRASLCSPGPDRCRFLRAAGRVRGRGAPAQRRRRRP